MAIHNSFVNDSFEHLALASQTGPSRHWYLQQGDGHPGFVNDIFERIASSLVGFSHDHILFFRLPRQLSSSLSALEHERPLLRKMSIPWYIANG